MKLKLQRFFKLHENRPTLFLLTCDSHSKPVQAQSVLGNIYFVDINSAVGYPLAIVRHFHRLTGRAELLRPASQRKAQGKDLLFIFLVKSVFYAVCMSDGEVEQEKGRKEK